MGSHSFHKLVRLFRLSLLSRGPGPVPHSFNKTLQYSLGKLQASFQQDTYTLDAKTKRLFCMSNMSDCEEKDLSSRTGGQFYFEKVSTKLNMKRWVPVQDLN